MDLDSVGKFVGLGHTFAAHAPDPVDWPVLWLEPPEALVADGEPVQLTPEVESAGVGPELTAVVGEELWRASPGEAAAAIRGFTVSNDVSAGGDWPGHPNESTLSRAYKMFPTFRPTLPEVVPLDVEEAADLRIEAFVDGERIADDTTANLRFSIPEMVAEVSRVFPLHEDDLVALGEPHTSAGIEDGVTTTCRVEGIGELSNPVERV